MAPRFESGKAAVSSRKHGGSAGSCGVPGSRPGALAHCARRADRTRGARGRRWAAPAVLPGDGV